MRQERDIAVPGLSKAADHRPRYIQVKESVLQRIAAGEWAAGDVLPSELSLAQAYGVAPGTMRKAVDLLVAENLLIRRHGKGTYVTTFEWRSMVWNIFRLEGDDGSRAIPSARVVRHTRGKASAREAARLGVPRGERILRVVRVRHFAQAPIVVELLALPLALFPGMAAGQLDLPPALYEFYAREFGIVIKESEERLRAVAANSEEAGLLDIAEGAPLLEIDRTTLDVRGRVVEWRVSHCHTERHHYRNRGA